MRLRIATGLVAVAGVALGGACAETGLDSPAPHGVRPNVLLVTLDTTRADRVQLDPDDPGSTPFLAGLARQGVRFPRAYATSSWTPPSMASLVTGAYPSRHGVEKSVVWPKPVLTVLSQQSLPDATPLLAELLHTAGYATFGITANQVLSEKFGYGRGFDRYRCLGFEDDGERVLEVLSEWLPEIQGKQPWFVWLHFLDPHSPYRAREPFFSSRWPAAAPRFRELEETVPAEQLHGKVRPKGPRLRYIRSLYESEIAATDAWVGQAFERLAVSGNALALVTADHGEEFLEHRGFGHSHNLHEESVRVPMLVRFPGSWGAGRAVASPVSLVDVVPTILDVAGVDPPPALQGQSLIAVVQGEHADRPVFAELSRETEASAVIQGRWKLLDRKTEGDILLADLDADPGERVNVADSHPAHAARLAALLEVHARTSAAGRSGNNVVRELDPEQAEALRALGYAP